jgi:hypothetical protein
MSKAKRVAQGNRRREFATGRAWPWPLKIEHVAWWLKTGAMPPRRPEGDDA